MKARITPWQPTDEVRNLVETMSAAGIPQERIAKALNISARTLARHCAAELINGETKAITGVFRFLYDAATGKETYSHKTVDENGNEHYEIRTRYVGATGPCVTAAIFYLKTKAWRMGWRQPRWDEVAPDTGPGTMIVFQGADANQ